MSSCPRGPQLELRLVPRVEVKVALEDLKETDAIANVAFLHTNLTLISFGNWTNLVSMRKTSR